MARSADSAPDPRPWRRLLPWLLTVLLLHGWLLSPEPPAALRTPTPGLQWRLAPPTAASAAPAPALAQGDRGRQAGAAPTRAAERRPAQLPPNRQPAPALVWQPSSTWHYRLRWQGEEGVAQLEWRIQGDRYWLGLQRQLGSRSLPSWYSEGQLGSEGLRPQRFIVQRATGKRQRVDTEVEAGAQDRLSWIFQAAAIARAQQARPGQSLHLTVSGWRGGVQAWELRAEHDAEFPALLRLRRLPPFAGSPLQQMLWLDPAQGHLPVRLRQRYDEAERWELELEAGPSIDASAPPAG